MPKTELHGAGWRRPLTVLATAALAASGAFVLATGAGAAGATVYVGTGGLDVAACGTAVLKCKTIQYGIDRAAAGDTVAVAMGTYNEAVHIIGKPVSLVADPGAIIDGAGKDQSVEGAYGVVYVGDNAGPVSVNGFTIKNPIAFPAAGGAYDTVALHNTNSAGSVALVGNTILGNAAASSPTSGQIGVAAGDNAATTTISGNDISGVFAGVRLADGGPATVSGNTVHDLVAHDYGAAKLAGGQGIVSLSAAGSAVTGQVVTGNTLRGYAGLGVALTSGYANTDCTPAPQNNSCTGSVSGTVTGNTVHLSATDSATTLPGAAVYLGATKAGTTTVALGGNTGDVAAPTRPVQEMTSDGGDLRVTSSGAPNAITPTPTPTLSSTGPTIIQTTRPALASTVLTATNPVDGDAIPHARYSVAITSKASVSSTQVSIERKVGSGYVAVPLSGSTAGGGAITGSFDLPTTGSALPADGTAVTSDLHVTIPGATVPAETLSLRSTLVEVSAGDSDAVLNAVVSDVRTIDVLASTTLGTPTYSPTHPTSAKAPTITVPVSAPGAKVDGGVLSVRTGEYLFSATVTNGKATLPLLKYTAGRHLLTVRYSGSDDAAPASRVYSLTVAKAGSALSVALSPTRITGTTRNAKAIVTVKAGGAIVDSGTVTISSNATPKIGAAKVVKGRATIALPQLRKGKRTWKISYTGTKYAAARTISYTFTTY